MHYCRDADVLRDGFTLAFDDVSDSHVLATCAELYALLDIPCLNTQVNGYSQGDWAELLIVATPEAQKEFGATAVSPEDLENQAKLYAAWAYGDVYGYVVEARTGEPFETEDDEWEEIPDGSCWDFYGSDFDWSGLEEQAMSVVDAHAGENVDV